MSVLEDALTVAIYRIMEARRELDEHKSIAWASAHHTLDKALFPMDHDALFLGYKQVPKEAMKAAEARLLDATAAERAELARAAGLVDARPGKSAA